MVEQTQKKRNLKSNSELINPETDECNFSLEVATEMDEKGNIVLLKNGLKYCEVIENLFDFLTNGDIAADLPPIPTYLNMTSKETFQDSIYELLRVAGGGQRLINIIAPNNLDEYGNISNFLAQIEGEPYVQALRAHVGTPLGLCLRISEGKVLIPVRIHRPAPLNPTSLLVFE